MSKKSFLILNGPNLDQLGKREPEIYGSLSLQEIQEYTEKSLDRSDVSLDWFQSNLEGELVSKIHEACDQDFDAIIINPAAYSHTSVAILDALKLYKNPVIEVHLSNTNLREDFRQIKLTAKASTAVIEGLGKNAYLIGIMSQLQ